MRNRQGGLAVSPVLVGAVTVLVIIVAVFLAYNANNGLPFVSTYDLKARVSNADALVKANEVRIGGARVGVVKSVVPVQRKNGAVEAELTLSLDKSAEPIPNDSTILVRPKSPLGLKYLQITPGSSTTGYKAGETIPVRYAKPEPGDIDKFFDMFNTPTRKAIQRNLAGFGNALAGRGPQLNEALGALRGLVEEGEPAAATLASSTTNLGGFFRALEAFSATLAPVAGTQASMFVALDQTFAAFAHVSTPYIEETIEKGPPTLDTVNADLPQINPFLHDTARFFTALRPGARALQETAPIIAESLHAGIPALNASPVLNNQLVPTAQALLAFQEAEGTMTGLQLLTDLNKNLKEPLEYIVPAQTKCYYATLLFSNLSSSNGQGNKYGKWLNVISFEPAEGPNNEGGQASAPANGPEEANHLHYNPFPRAGQEGVCEAGNIKYLKNKTVIGNVPTSELHGTDTRHFATNSSKEQGE
jgi:ABC-type transporter Mla subunit MlaD